MKKLIILHYHIYKNGGTTVDGALKKSFPPLLYIDNYFKKDMLFKSDDLLECIKNKKFGAITSHGLRFPKPIHPDYEFLPLIFIRHPIDRAFSLYYFHKLPQVGLFHEAVKNLSLKEFVQYIIDSKVSVARNTQTMWLTKQHFCEKIEKIDFDKACQRIEKECIYGLVEKMDQSLILIEEKLKDDFPKINLSYVRRNVLRTGQTLEERLKKAELEIGEDLMKKLIDLNYFDFKLYELVNKNIDEKIKNLDDYEKKLQNFIDRCKKRGRSFDGLKNRLHKYKMKATYNYYLKIRPQH